LGKGASIQSGCAEGAVLLDGAVARGGVEIRPAALLEEHVNVAQCAGLKMTIALAHTFFGSLINYCDVFVQAGMDNDHYTEIGSGAIHFNNSPALIKYPSLIGTVESLFHTTPLIFVGGLSKLIAPVTVAPGAVIAAGSRAARPVERDTLFFDPGQPLTQPAEHDRVRGAIHKLRIVIEYLANVAALRDWYAVVRIPLAADALEAALLKKAAGVTESNLRERFHWIALLFEKGGLTCPGDPADRLNSSLPLNEKEARKRLGFVAEELSRTNRAMGFQDRVRALPAEIKTHGVAALRETVEAWRAKINHALLK
ncbi:MAG: hypothetical protein NTW86_31000, partial [Candidatus Sumerlaeota bacterium]|nr:hypothetical protein [Candidatus Sumerlaeota bacterium]